MNYKRIIIEESLHDLTVLNQLKVISTRLEDIQFGQSFTDQHSGRG